MRKYIISTINDDTQLTLTSENKKDLILGYSLGLFYIHISMEGKSKRRREGHKDDYQGDRPVKKLKLQRKQFDLSGQYKKVIVQQFKGQIQISIRQFFKKDNELIPKKRGFTMNLTQWNQFSKHIGQIDKILNKL